MGHHSGSGTTAATIAMVHSVLSINACFCVICATKTSTWGVRQMSIVGGRYRKTRGVMLTGLSLFWEKVFLMYGEYFYFYFIPK